MSEKEFINELKSFTVKYEEAEVKRKERENLIRNGMSTEECESALGLLSKEINAMGDIAKCCKIYFNKTV